MSFPSGHSSTAGAATFGLAHPIVLTSDLSPGAAAGLYGAATAWTASTVVLRVAARKRYPTDVLWGRLLGASVGIVVPELHRASRMRLSAGGVPPPAGVVDGEAEGERGGGSQCVAVVILEAPIGRRAW